MRVIDGHGWTLLMISHRYKRQDERRKGKEKERKRADGREAGLDEINL